MTATPEATPTATNVPLEGVHPSGTRTGIEDVDAVIAAVEEGDLEALMALVEYQPAECVPPPAQGLGGPPLCEEGEPAGTVVEVFPAAACEGYLERDARQLIEAAADTPGLYAVLEGPAAEREEVWWPLGDYIVVFASPEGRQPSGQSLVIEDGRIVRAQLGCFSPDELMTYRGEPLPAIIAPPSP